MLVIIKTLDLLKVENEFMRRVEQKDLLGTRMPSTEAEKHSFTVMLQNELNESFASTDCFARYHGSVIPEVFVCMEENSMSLSVEWSIHSRY